MLLTATLASLLAADPTVVFIQARSGLPAEEFKKALTVIDAELARAGNVWTTDESTKRLKAAGSPDASTCGGKQQCLLDAAKKLQARWMITISASKVGRDRAWALAAFEVKTGAELAREEWLDESTSDVTQPAATFTNRLAPLIKPKDVPVVAKLEPPPPPVEKPLVVEAPATPASRPLPKVLLIAACVAGAAAIGLAAGSAVNTGTLNQTTTSPEGLRLSPHTTSQAETLVSTSNALTGAAIASGVVAAGLGVGAVLTW